MKNGSFIKLLEYSTLENFSTHPDEVQVNPACPHPGLLIVRGGQIIAELLISNV
jgi:hypothetical protein